jgi:hypothetical protein
VVNAGFEGCHARQHRIGELSFWAALGVDPINLSARLWAVTGDTEQALRALARFRQSIELYRGGDSV